MLGRLQKNGLSQSKAGLKLLYTHVYTPKVIEYSLCVRKQEPLT